KPVPGRFRAVPRGRRARPCWFGNITILFISTSGPAEAKRGARMNSALRAFGLLLDFLVHEVVAVAAFVILVLATCAIHAVAQHLQDALCKKVYPYIEGGLFFIGAALVVVITLSLTWE